MQKEEKEYYLRIIQLLEQQVQGMGSKNFTKMVIAQKELERMQKQPFDEAIKEMKTKKEDSIKRFKNLLTELESVMKDLVYG